MVTQVSGACAKAQAPLFYPLSYAGHHRSLPFWRDNRRLLLKINTITDSLSAGQGIAVADRGPDIMKSPCHCYVLVCG
ncbi:hypothetical protein A7K99_07905 [Tatumella citrea]|uniref:Uncharacterized protein n=1 Tax=Tatumella citrea TaxID=53336 RepID=A0A1Y0LI21_TATCI|nr:hypothetical protein A7K98_07905 [Tatumella citrea]ARU97744.1 hypothetical protein A7K99_07905 [Tatumella citrea]